MDISSCSTQQAMSSLKESLDIFIDKNGLKDNSKIIVQESNYFAGPSSYSKTYVGTLHIHDKTDSISVNSIFDAPYAPTNKEAATLSLYRDGRVALQELVISIPTEDQIEAGSYYPHGYVTIENYICENNSYTDTTANNSFALIARCSSAYCSNICCTTSVSKLISLMPFDSDNYNDLLSLEYIAL